LCAKVYSIPNSIPKDERDDIFLSLKKLINAIQVCWYSKWRQYTLLLIDLFDYCSKQFTTIPLFKEEKIKDYVSSIKNNIFLIFAGFFSKLLEGKPSKIYAPIILYGKYSFFYKCLDDSLSLDSKDKVRILEKIESALEDEFSKNKYLELIMSASLNDIHDRKVVFINQSKKEGVNEKNAMPFIFIAKVKNIFESRIFMEYIRSFISKNEEAIAKEKEPMETVLAPEIFTYKFISEFLSKNNKWSHHRANNENSLEKNVGFDKHVKAKGAEYLYGVKRIKEDYFSPDRPSSALAKIEHFPFNKQK